MSIVRLPSSTKALLSTAPLYPSFETTVSTTFSLLHASSTSTNIDIHPTALRFKISTNGSKPPPIEHLTPLSILSSLELTTPTCSTHIRKGNILNTDRVTPTERCNGVSLDVWELFCATPVRRRLEIGRDASSVVAATRELVVRIALLHPGKKVSLASDTPIYTFSGCINPDALQAAFGLDVHWLRVYQREADTAITGYMAREGVGNTRYQLCGRDGVHDDTICEIVGDVWKRMPKDGRRRCAAFVINIQGNVSEEVVRNAVKEAFGVKNRRDAVKDRTQRMIELRRTKKRVSLGTSKRFEDAMIQRPLLKRPVSEGRLSIKVEGTVGKRPASAVEDAYKRMIPSWKNPCLPSRGRAKLSGIYDKRSVCISRERIATVRIVGQVDKKFIVIADAYGVYAVDQHAASERYLYETLLKRCLKERRAHKLANPRAVNIPYELRPLVRKVVPEAEKWGWRMEDDIVVTHVPELPPIDVVLRPECLTEWFEDCFRGGKQMPSAVISAVASAACHAAVRFGDQLTKEMCSSIVTSLAECDMPFVCAHGRPNVVPIAVFDVVSNVRNGIS